jgi:hypothetical protein
MRWATRVSGGRLDCELVYLEIFHWRHLTKTLRFNPPPPPPGSHIEARPGLPLLVVLAGSAIAPAVFAALVVKDRTGREQGRPGDSPGSRRVRRRPQDLQ